jgi:hypothetical protein
MDEWIGWMGYFRRGDSVTVCAGFIPRRPAQELSPSTPGLSGGRFRSPQGSVTKCAAARIHSSRTKRLYWFCTGCIPQGALSLRRNYRPTPQTPPRGIRGQIPVTTKPVPTVGILPDTGVTGYYITHRGCRRHVWPVLERPAGTT